MANFPGGLDNFTNPTPADNLNTPTVLHSDQHANINDAVEAVEVKVGIDGSADPSSLDYKMSHHAHTGADGSVQVDYDDLLNKPVIPPGVTPSATVEDETAYGQSPDAGISDDFSRGDHTHGTVPHDSYNNLTDVPTEFPPEAHATTHENGGADEINVAGLTGLLATSQTPILHAATHQNGGTDEISVAGLSGVLADPQTAIAHNVLSAIHGDTLTASVVRGDLLVGNNTPLWSRLAIGAANRYLASDGTDPSWQEIDAGHIGGGQTLSKVDDTNVTLTLGGTPATALLQDVSLTLGWTGTLAANRLNANVVQSVVNDTNVTGSIAAQALTLGWTGTLAAARLNANVVQAITNDTNVTGSISAQNLTLGWTGTLSVARGGTGAGSLDDIVGTTNQVIVTDGADTVIGGNVTLSLPQNIHTAATPQFARLGLGAAADATVLLTLSGAAPSTQWIDTTGGARPLTLVVDGNTADWSTTTLGRLMSWILSTGEIVVDNDLSISGNLDVDGNGSLGSSAADTLAVNATIVSHLLFTDNTYDIGASGATRPRSLYVSTSAVIGSGTGNGAVANLLNVTGNHSGAGDYLAGVFLTNFTGTTATSAQALEGWVEANHASGTLTSAFGVIGHIEHIGAGAITNMIAFESSNIIQTGTGNVTNSYNYRASPLVRIGSPGTVTNAYAFFADTMTATGVTNKWAFYSAGTSDKSYFAGQVGIGATSPTAGYKLEASDSILVNSTTNNSGFNVIFTGASGTGHGPQNSFTVNDNSALEDNHRIGALLYSAYDGGGVQLGAALIVQAEGAWASGTARGTRISFLTTNSGGTTLSTPFVIRSGSLTLADAVNIAVNATTGTKIGTAASQKLGFWNATPVVQPTTAIAASTFTANAGTAVNDASTFAGYTIRQVVNALRTIGILA